MSPLPISDPTMASPSRSWSSASSAWRTSSVSGSAGVSVSADDNGLTSPALGHVLALDALLEQHDALEQGLRARRATWDVDVDGDDLVDALGHRVRVPIRPAAVGA